MSASITVRNQDQTTARLVVEEGKLVIQALDNKSDVKTIDLEFIYGIDYHEDKIDIHTAMIQDTATEKIEANANQTLTNIRPKDVKWILQTLHYQTDAAPTTMEASSSLSEFVTQLKAQATPHHLTFPDTEVIVVLNPTSGAQLAESQWTSIVKPMLITAGFAESNLSKIATERDGKTRALAEALGQRILSTTASGKPTPIIISMGGDGTLHEVVNGLSDAAADASDSQGHFRLGVIPAGSGNAFALGLNIESVQQATLKIIKGLEEKPFYFMDVKFGHSEHDKQWQDHVVYDETRKPVRLLVVLSWGFHAQIVSKSRYLRYFMGNKRFSLVAMFLLTFLQQYEGELVLRGSRTYNKDDGEFDGPPHTMFLEKDDKFTYFIVSKQHSLEKGFKIAPFASSLSDDMDVVILREADKDSLTKASIAAFQGGEHVKLQGVEYFKAKELLLRVQDKAELCLDGEIHDVPSKGIVHMKVEKSSTEKLAFTIFV
ncbi:Very-long-chain 3-oxoacyl-CoA reductase [Mucor velutinosus]|uniref:Very-long-chain 3-oxoacyl-CoA reductase n=1 Tax=Mucor velutinosus TaxID=708070 RepID=A0AAN7D9V4_9FUNG|nr:Very-long-chain 3-oxoacyl-CoA reductase [Mucor velutinosus]